MTDVPPATGPATPYRHAHLHKLDPRTSARRIAASLGLISVFFVVEAGAALVSRSLALWADAGHMLTDVSALAISAWALHLSHRPASSRWTYGLKRAEILSAAINGVALAVIAIIIAVEAVVRLGSSRSVSGRVVLGVAVVGALVNVVAVRVLSGADRSSLNVKGAYAHILSDLWAFIGTAIAGLVIVLLHWPRADAVAALVVCALIAHTSWGLLRDAGRILLQGAPDDLDLVAVRLHLLDVPHVIGLHDLHAWTVTSGSPTLSAHIVVEDHCFETGHAPQVLDELQACLSEHFELTHVTFQLETRSHDAHENIDCE